MIYTHIIMRTSSVFTVTTTATSKLFYTLAFTSWTSSHLSLCPLKGSD